MTSQPVWIPLLDLGREQEWQVSASCAESNPDSFFPEKGESLAPARAVCARCDVAEECLNYVMGRLAEGHEEYGVWAGTSKFQRRDLLTGKKNSDMDDVHRQIDARARRERDERIVAARKLGVPPMLVAAHEGVCDRTVYRATARLKLEDAA